MHLSIFLVEVLFARLIDFVALCSLTLMLYVCTESSDQYPYPVNNVCLLLCQHVEKVDKNFVLEAV